MAFVKYVVFAGLLAFVAAQSQEDLIYGDIPRYQFHYSVNDPNTGDQKEQEESREGDAVRGSYSLIEPDGTLRRVDYTADDVHGFQATVSKTPGAAHPIQAPVVHAIAQPAVHIAAPQIVHAAPQIIQQAPQIIQAYHAPQIVHAAPQLIQSAPRIISAGPISSGIIQSAPRIISATPISSGIIHSGPIINSVPQYINNRVISL